MSPSPAKTDPQDGGSLRRSLLLNVGITVLLLSIAVQYPMRPAPVVGAFAIGAGAGYGLAALVDRFRTRLGQWNDLLVIGLVVGIVLSLYAGASYLLPADAVGYQAAGTIAAVWAFALQHALDGRRAGAATD